MITSAEHFGVLYWQTSAEISSTLTDISFSSSYLLRQSVRFEHVKLRQGSVWLWVTRPYGDGSWGRCFDSRDVSLMMPGSSSESVYNSELSLVARCLKVPLDTVWPTSRITLARPVNRNMPNVNKSRRTKLRAPVMTYIAMARHMMRTTWRELSPFVDTSINMTEMLQCRMTRTRLSFYNLFFIAG